MFTRTLLVVLILSTYLNLTREKSWTKQQYEHQLLNPKMSTATRKPLYLPINKNKNKSIIFLILLLQSGDIELNPGPKTANVFPCGMCENPVTWSNDAVCCDNCSIWHHKSCIELCTMDYELLQRSNVQWMCCKCDSLNVSSFTFHSYEIENTSYYEPLTIEESFSYSFVNKFSPMKTSSPKQQSDKSANSSNNSAKDNSTKTTRNCPRKRTCAF
jgi:hypothetical protein